MDNQETYETMDTLEEKRRNKGSLRNLRKRWLSQGHLGNQWLNLENHGNLRNLGKPIVKLGKPWKPEEPRDTISKPGNPEEAWGNHGNLRNQLNHG